VEIKLFIRMTNNNLAQLLQKMHYNIIHRFIELGQNIFLKNHSKTNNNTKKIDKVLPIIYPKFFKS
jgi:hypothetical protein